ncbi:MAG: hypothetical protein N2316_07895 [Spirochaetes bacterium]|nr:hypothetical protein [Spirochaetota bacterium]
MSFFKDASEAFLRYTEKIVNKTELYAKIGRLIVDIKRMENDIQKIHREIGEYIYTKFSNGAFPIQSDDTTLNTKCEKIQELLDLIAKKREEIAELRRIAEERSAMYSSNNRSHGSTQQ